MEAARLLNLQKQTTTHGRPSAEFSRLPEERRSIQLRGGSLRLYELRMGAQPRHQGQPLDGEGGVTIQFAHLFSAHVRRRSTDDLSFKGN